LLDCIVALFIFDVQDAACVSFLFRVGASPVVVNLSVSDTLRFDPALLSQGKRDKKAELDQLLGGKVLM
jgi:hypothetical protein